MVVASLAAMVVASLRPAADECAAAAVAGSSSSTSGSRCLATELAPGCAPLVGEGCPGDAWFDELAKRFPPAQPILLNVGANKGYAIADFFARHDPTMVANGVSASAWHKAIRNISAEIKSGNLEFMACGVCKACKRKPPFPEAKARHRADAAPVRAHALELLASNRRIIRHAARRTGIEAHVTVHDVAAANESATMAAPSDDLIGVETTSLGMGRRQSASGGQRVQVVALDDFLARGLGVQLPPLEMMNSIYHLSIDTEGWDALVLEGARKSIAQRRFRLIEFEFRLNLGYWFGGHRDCRDLGALLQWLHRSGGYRCFWQTRVYLVPTSAECFRPQYAAEADWGNLLCAHEPEVLSFLETRFMPPSPRRLLDHYASEFKRVRKSALINHRHRSFFHEGLWERHKCAGGGGVPGAHAAKKKKGNKQHEWRCNCMRTQE